MKRIPIYSPPSSPTSSPISYPSHTDSSSSFSTDSSPPTRPPSPPTRPSSPIRSRTPSICSDRSTLSGSDPSTHTDGTLYTDPSSHVCTSARVLILQFEYHDLGDDLEDSSRNVRSAFQHKRYDVELFLIPMDPRRTSRELDRVLREFLRSGDRNTLLLIYYNGHGGMGRSADGELELASHNLPDNPERLQRNASEMWEGLQHSTAERHHLARRYERYQRPARVLWSDIVDQVMKANRDVGIILNTCQAGAAARDFLGISGLRLEGPMLHPKEIIAATGWTGKSWGQMGIALCRILRRWNPRVHGPISMETLFEGLTDRLARDNVQHSPQPVRWRLHDSRTGRDVMLPVVSSRRN